jgi:hypothetical protein
MEKKWKILIAIFIVFNIAIFVVSDGNKYCRDGSITFSSGSGTCSWHGGKDMQPAKKWVWWIFLGALGLWGYASFKRPPLPPQKNTSADANAIEQPQPQPQPQPLFPKFTKPFRPPQNRHPPCPNCGAEMWVRVARRGSNRGMKFLGCSSYPYCKGTRSII